MTLGINDLLQAVVGDAIGSDDYVALDEVSRAIGEYIWYCQSL